MLSNVTNELLGCLQKQQLIIFRKILDGLTGEVALLLDLEE